MPQRPPHLLGIELRSRPVPVSIDLVGRAAPAPKIDLRPGLYLRQVGGQ
jgi:hypothetical protein